MPKCLKKWKSFSHEQASFLHSFNSFQNYLLHTAIHSCLISENYIPKINENLLLILRNTFAVTRSTFMFSVIFLAIIFFEQKFDSENKMIDPVIVNAVIFDVIFLAIIFLGKKFDSEN